MQFFLFSTGVSSKEELAEERVLLLGSIKKPLNWGSSGWGLWTTLCRVIEGGGLEVDPLPTFNDFSLATFKTCSDPSGWRISCSKTKKLVH